ncbi:MAG: ABC transporter ATP-binding protein [Fibrobacter sp.]|nr:ABC transporter ATP-binding protein [Fibrobacter sp.]
MSVQSGFEATNLGFSYDGKPILKDINLKINQGEFVCLLGESGSGKTTLLNLFAGLTKPNEGNITWKGKQIEKPSSERSVVFQDYSLFPWLTLLQNVSLAVKKTKKVKGKYAKHLAEEYLSLVGLSRSLHKYPFELSGGMRQRGAIARALSVGADALLLDEPFGALDPVNRASLQDLILELCRGTKDRPITTLFVTHDIREAVYLGSRIIVLGSTPGRIIADIPLDFPAKKNRSEWFRNEQVQKTIVTIEEAYHKDVLEKLGHIVEGGASI